MAARPGIRGHDLSESADVQVTIDTIRWISLGPGDTGERDGHVTNAVIFVQPEKFHANAARCLDYCAAMRYEVAGLICGDWAAALQMVRNGLAAVIVVPAMTQIDPSGEPRIEVVPRRANARRLASRSRFGPRVIAR
jgi:hypothetical protein